MAFPKIILYFKIMCAVLIKLNFQCVKIRNAKKEAVVCGLAIIPFGVISDLPTDYQLDIKLHCE